MLTARRAGRLSGLSLLPRYWPVARHLTVGGNGHIHVEDDALAGRPR